MKLYRAMLAGALAMTMIGAKPPPPDLERVIDIGAGELIDATVNGRPMKLRVDLGTPDWVMLNAASAARAGLDGSMIGGSRKIGPIKLRIDSSLTKLKVGSYRKGRRIFWFDRDVTEGADGLISPSVIPENRVTLKLGPAMQGERTIVLDVDHSMIRGFRHKLAVGDESLWITFAPERPMSVATAASGAHLAETNDGHWTGPPEKVRVELGIDRPGRPMELRRPLDIGGLASRSFMVRTADYRGSFQLPPEEDADPDEIVVTGKTSKGRAQLWLTLGRDTLGRCSSITHDKRRETLTLRCLPLSG